MLLDIREYKDFAKHFPEKQSKDFVDYIENIAFLSSRYLFTEKRGKEHFGFCTHCKQEYVIPKLRHLDLFKCTSCGSECGVRSSNRGRKYMLDEAYVVWYEKSELNPQAITARGVYVIRDYRGDYRQVKTLYEVRSMYLFVPGQGGGMIDRPVYYSKDRGVVGDRNKWFGNKSVHSLGHTVMANKVCYCSKESIKAAIKDTPFQYSTWDSYKDGDFVRFFDLYAKYPCIEYLTKIGFKDIVETKLSGGKTHGAIDWRAKNLFGVLRLNKQELNNLRESKLEVSTWFLFLLQKAKKEGIRLNLQEIHALATEISDSRVNEFRTALSRTTFSKLISYLVKQQNNPEVFEHYKSKGQILSTWNDYIDDCFKLGLDISQQTVRFPKNLYQAHQNTIKQIKLKEDAALQKKFAIRRKQLEKMCFGAQGFLIRPASDQKELIEEGKALIHCVGTYAGRYAKGETDILLIRKVDEPHKPFYTMEIRGGEIMQCRGLKNCNPTDEVKAFIEEFKAMKLMKKSKKSAPKQMTELEVAV